MKRDTAILLFSRTAAAEADEKNFAGSFSKSINGKIARRFFKTAYNTAVSSELSLHTINEHNQKGETFGEKLSNAIQEVFDFGYEKLIVIGNDCPQLAVAHIHDAAHALESSNIVLGPDNHGGVYLIGLTRKVFDRKSFETRQWQTNGLYKDLQSFYENETSFCLPHLCDVNNFEDLKFVKHLLPSSHTLIVLLVSLLASLHRKISRSPIVYSNRSFSLLPLRAPPAL